MLACLFFVVTYSTYLKIPSGILGGHGHIATKHWHRKRQQQNYTIINIKFKISCNHQSCIIIPTAWLFHSLSMLPVPMSRAPPPTENHGTLRAWSCGASFGSKAERRMPCDLTVSGRLVRIRTTKTWNDENKEKACKNCFKIETCLNKQTVPACTSTLWRGVI